MSDEIKAMQVLDFEIIKTGLLKKDPNLKVVLENYKPEESKSSNSDYVHLISIIVGQQLSGAAAKTIFGRLTNLIGEDFREIDLLKLEVHDFAKIGISKAKTQYVRDISTYLIKNPEFFANLKKQNSEKQIAELINFKGVGIWTASIFVMSSDLMSDIFAFGDGTLNKVLKTLYNIPDENFEDTLIKIIDKWSPYKTLICNALWHYNDNILTQTRNRI